MAPQSPEREGKRRTQRSQNYSGRKIPRLRWNIPARLTQIHDVESSKLRRRIVSPVNLGSCILAFLKGLRQCSGRKLMSPPYVLAVVYDENDRCARYRGGTCQWRIQHKSVICMLVYAQ